MRGEIKTNYNSSLLLRNAEAFGFTLSDESLRNFDLLAGALAEQNRFVNLTSVDDPDGIAVKHFADSLSVLTAVEIEKGAMLLDVGTGAGFPGLPLLIARPDLRLTLLDGTLKKLRFAASFLEKTGLNAEILHARAEEAGKTPERRERYDVVCSRATAVLNVLCEYCLPFVKKGGVFVAMKSAKAGGEIEAARGAVKLLGGKLESQKTFFLSDGSGRTLVVIRKISRVPTKYPRASAQIAKRPL